MSLSGQTRLEYPMRDSALGTKIGTATVNGRRSLMDLSFVFVSLQDVEARARTYILQGCLNMRILLHRGFLRLVTLDKKQGLSDAIAPASKCVKLVCDLIETITYSMNTGGSGTLQAALFSALGYLWNATITLMLYLLSQKALQHLPHDLMYPYDGAELLQSTISFFSQYRSVVPFADAAATKTQRFLDKIKARTTPNMSENATNPQDQAGGEMHFDGSNELLETFFMLDAPLTGIANMPDQDFELMHEYDAIHSQFNMWPDRGW